MAKRMIAGNVHGSIVNLASAAARGLRPGMTTYSVTKLCVWMLTRGLALELAPYRICVNTSGPGLIASPMTYAYFGGEEGVEHMGQNAPLGRAGQPMDVANTALFLASDEPSFYTGSILHPDGGTLNQIAL